MCLWQDEAFYVLKEDESPCIFGSIEKQRWSYACAKQLIERLIYGIYNFFICPCHVLALLFVMILIDAKMIYLSSY